MKLRHFVVIAVILVSVGNCQLFSIPTPHHLFLPRLSLPNLDDLLRTSPNQIAFLVDFFNVTLSDLKSLWEDFDFRDITPSDINFHLLIKSSDSTSLTRDVRKIDVTKPIKIIIHGWKSTFKEDFITNLSSNYHKRGNYTVIAVDWSRYSSTNYHHACTAVYNVGIIVGDFILDLVKKNASLLNNIHLIGHSLGAHVAGVAGKKIKGGSGRLLGRVTALDAAAPLFEFPTKQPLRYRVSKGDAKFVDAIHTNAGFLGITDAVADADFYVADGGPVQPGCDKTINLLESFACSHFKSNEYFGNSVLGTRYEATFCGDSASYHSLQCTGNHKTVMGEDVDKLAIGLAG